MTEFNPFLPPTPEYVQAWMQRYARWGPNGSKGPELLVREVFGITPDDWQVMFLEAYGRYERRMTERSGHGPGKTAALGWIIVHHAITEFPQKTAVTAPTEKQMFVALFPEVVRWFHKLPDWVQQAFTVKSESLVHSTKPEESFVSFATARAEKPEALAGIHSEDGSVLLVADEASGVHEAVFESASGSMSGRNATTILAGNPVRTAGLFYDSHTKLARRGNPSPGDWFAIHVNCEDVPRVSRDFIADMARRYGVDSNAYRVRVRGEFPTADSDTIIPMEHILQAQQRDIVMPPLTPWVWGVDVARFGDDRTALVKRQGKVVRDVPQTWQGKDLMQVSALIHAEWTSCPTLERPRKILVDSIGLGAGVVDRLRALGLPAMGINVSERPSNSEQYANLKAELWFKAKQWFAGQDVKLPPDSTEAGGIALGAELGLPRFRFLPSGKFQVESKMEIKKRGFPSPDVGDAFILTLADNEATMLHGKAYSDHEPLKRGLQGVV